MPRSVSSANNSINTIFRDNISARSHGLKPAQTAAIKNSRRCLYSMTLHDIVVIRRQIL